MSLSSLKSATPVLYAQTQVQQFDLPRGSANHILRFLHRFHIKPTPQDASCGVVHDPNDTRVPSSVIAAKADVLVTGYKDILSAKGKAGTIITNHRGFCNILKEETGN